MSTTISKWRPSWWSDEVHGSAWERAQEAMRRDWAQTKHDLHLGGHEMNQSLTDTLKQAAGQELERPQGDGEQGQRDEDSSLLHGRAPQSSRLGNGRSSSGFVPRLA